jgi:integral membrane protein
MLQTPIGRLRAIGLIEGLSYLLLLGVAMPLKYFASFPLAVKVGGWIHGVFFILFCAALAQAMFTARWSIVRAGLIFIASLVPFGTLVIDGRLKREDEASRAAATKA